MNDKTKILSLLVLGAIAGAAIVKLLETDKGKELVDKAKAKAKSAVDDIKVKINELESELAELLQTQKENQTNNQV